MIQYRKIIASLILCVILLSAGLAIAKLLIATRVQPMRHVAQDIAPVVETVLVEVEDVVEHFVGYGTARPDRVAALASEVAATVVERVDNIEEGSTVGDKQELIRLDTREYNHLLEQALSRLQADVAYLNELAIEAAKLEEVISTAQLEVEVARSEKKRVSSLFEQGHAAKKEYDFANLAYQQARRVLQGFELELARNEPRQQQIRASQRGNEAARALAALNVARCTIQAPFAGTIEALTVDVGDRVSQGMTILTLIDPSHVEIPIQLPSGVHDRIQVGAVVHLNSESMPHLAWQGTVARLAASADSKSRTVAVYVDVDNTIQKHPLIPGTFVSADVQGAMYGQCLAVPRGAVREGQLLVIENDVARVRRVDVVRLVGDRAIVAGDLQVGDQVIASYTARLDNGSPARGLLAASKQAPQSNTKDLSLATQRETAP